MKRAFAITVICAIAVACMGCSQEKAPEPELARMKSICELAVMDCYYHDVAKTNNDDVSGILLWKKDLHFWIEYEAVVTLGIDASLVDISVNGSNVTITLPNAQILSKRVDSATLDESSYYLAADSISPSAEDQIAAFEYAVAGIEKQVLADTALLLEARNRAQLLLEQYVKNVGEAAGIEYAITWVYLDGRGDIANADAEAIEAHDIEGSTEAEP